MSQTCAVYKIFWNLHILFYFHPTCFFLNCLPLTPARLVPNIEFTLVMSYVLIWNFGRSLLLAIFLYSLSVACTTITCISHASFDFSTYLLVYPSNGLLNLWTSITTDSVFISSTKVIPLNSIEFSWRWYLPLWSVYNSILFSVTGDAMTRFLYSWYGEYFGYTIWVDQVIRSSQFPFLFISDTPGLNYP